MSDYWTCATRWADRGMGLTNKSEMRVREGRMYCDRQHRIFSYGSHFEMGRFLFDKKGKPTAILLNGDRASVTTSRHQSHVRSAAGRTGLPVVIVPYSALSVAGIEMDSLQIIEAQDSRTVTIKHEFFKMQPGWSWRTLEIKERVEKSPEEIQAIIDREYAGRLKSWEDKHQWALNEQKEAERTHFFFASYLDPASKPVRPTTLEECYGDQSWTLESLRHKDVVVAHEQVLFTTANSHTKISVDEMPDGRTRYHWTTTRHWLGGSLIRGKVVWSRWQRCKHCAGGHRRDVECDIHDRRCWAPEHTCQECRGNGGSTTMHSRWAYFLSDFDHQEPREAYFFCELPRGPKPTSIDEALDVLKPDTVKIAEQMGRKTLRQGDIFAVAMENIDRRALRKQGARFEKMGQLLRTNHRATEVAYLPNGQTLARGILWHRPERRRPDHIKVRLDDGRWHVILKNTVPVTVAGRG